MTKIFEIKVEKMTQGGQGLGHLDGKVCFVNKAIPGETARIEIVEDKKDYCVANPLEIIQASPHRINPECPIFNRCGGCQLQHIAYEYQLELKRDVFVETMRRIGKMEVPAGLPGGETPFFYRNRAQLPVQEGGGLKIGYYKPGTHRVVDQKQCPINHDLINRTLGVLRRRMTEAGVKAYDEQNHRGVLRHIVIKAGINTRQLFVTLVTTGLELDPRSYQDVHQDLPEVVGITQNVNPSRTNRILGKENRQLWGKDHYEERAEGLTYRIRTASFFQVNTVVFERILKTIRDRLPLDGHETVLDLYSGMGVIGSSLSPRIREVVAVEESEETVSDGIASARANGINNIRFLTGDVAVKLKEIESGDIAILDPPRKGVGQDVIEALARLSVKEVVYLSCNPATFARDAAYLRAQNYDLSEIVLFDMFPQTFHMETLGFFKHE
jgi:23S rRNA (uracil1939-C5)-methyltransferase